MADEVLEAMQPFWQEQWGNPSNRQHRLGLTAAAAVSLARDELANHLKVAPERVIFTSGATEANNLALIGHARAKASERGSPGHLVTLSTEHHAVLDPLRHLKHEGFSLTELTPHPDGLIHPEQLEHALREDTFLVSVMAANNEIGVLQPIEELAALCRQRGIPFHCDAAQAFGKVRFDPNAIGLDACSLSSHKIYGPKGIGALIKHPDLSIEPLQWGGGQEQGLRSGTLAVPLIVGFAKAAELALQDLELEYKRLKGLRDLLWQGLNIQIDDLVLNGSIKQRLPHNLNITIPGIKGSHLHRALRPLISCSSGSACSNGAPSHVLMALGRSSAEAEASLRLSLGRNSCKAQIDKAIKAIVSVVNRLRTE